MSKPIVSATLAALGIAGFAGVAIAAANAVSTQPSPSYVTPVSATRLSGSDDTTPRHGHGADDPATHDSVDDRLVLVRHDDPATHDAGDDNGTDDPATHDIGDDNGVDAADDVGDDNGVDDPATHDAGDDNGTDATTTTTAMTDDPVTQDAGDDNGIDDPATHDVGDDGGHGGGHGSDD